jgi:hypothetical protein
MDIEEILERVMQAVRTLLAADADLLSVDANERSLTARLAFHLQPFFPDWHVDCEYNRLGDDRIKRLPAASATRTDDTTGKTIFPDIIVHRRRLPENLLIIEMKKAHNEDVENDLIKLRTLTVPDGAFAYLCGVHLILDCRGGGHRAAVYLRGEHIEDLSRGVTQGINQHADDEDHHG